MSTIISRATPYMTADEFLKRADVRLVIKLCTSDLDDPPTIVNLELKPYLIEALRDASGLFESACLLGERYTVADLTAIADPLNKRNSTGLMFRILADITLAYLFELRPDMAPSPAMSARIDRATRWLDELSAGKKVFGLQETVEAGRMDHEDVERDDADRFYGQVEVADRLYGRRSDDFEAHP